MFISLVLASLELGCTYLDGVKLNAGLHNIHRGQSTMGDRTADSTSRGSLDVVHRVILGEVGRGRGEEGGTWSFHGHVAISRIDLLWKLI